MASSKHAPPHGKTNDTKKSYEEELKDDRFQGTGDSELDTTPPQKDKGGSTADKDKNPPAAEKDTSKDSSEG